LVHFSVLCNILWKFGAVCGNLVSFSRFGILYQEKSGNHAMLRPTFLATSTKAHIISIQNGNFFLESI
jgi:hypothetical protein